MSPPTQNGIPCGVGRLVSKKRNVHRIVTSRQRTEADVISTGVRYRVPAAADADAVRRAVHQARCGAC
jgi:hypothetical protein